MKHKLAVASGIVLALVLVAVVMNPLLLWIPFALTGQYGGLRTGARLEEAHERAVNSFAKSEGFGLSRMRHLSYWNDRTIIFSDREYQPYAVQLVGLTHETGGRVYLDSSPPKKDQILKSSHRPLTQFELEAVKEILDGKLLSSPVKQGFAPARDFEGSVQILAPLPYSENCLQCHIGATGKIAGAFMYTLMPQ